MIDRADRTAEGLGIPLWGEDEAGPDQAIPQPGPSWQPQGMPAHRPHEYVRGGTAKLLTLVRPATGEVRGQPTERTANAVVHPWVQTQVAAILAALPPVPAPTAPGRRATAWWWGGGDPPPWVDDLPPVRLLLVWANLAGHRTPTLVDWVVERGVWPLPTPLGGSWLNLAESIQRSLVRRALAGQQPTSAQEIMTWLTATVAGGTPPPPHLNGAASGRPGGRGHASGATPSVVPAAPPDMPCHGAIVRPPISQ